MTKGKITQVLGAVIDVQFESNIPAILNALKYKNGKREITFEVMQHLGDGIVRAVAMDLTDELARGDEITDTGKPITIPVGRATLGRIIDVTGNPIDGKGAVSSKESAQIHRNSPDITNLATKTEILATGIKVIDLLSPYIKG